MNNELDIDLFATAVLGIIRKYFDIIAYFPSRDYVRFHANPVLHKRGWKRDMNRRLSAVHARARISREGETYHITVFPVARTTGRPALTNIILFCLTFLTILAAAAYQEVGWAYLKNPSLLLSGLPFTLTLLGILLVHEMGHFWVGHGRGIAMSYPYFIPAPNFLGTFGAVIRGRSPIRTRGDLILVGAAGPLAGAVPAVIALVIGCAFSHITPIKEVPEFTLGNSVFTYVVQHLFFGDIPPGMMIDFSPVAMAAKVGLLVTMLNLLPLGQLDGGHILYGLFQKGQHYLAVVFLACLGALGYLWPGWWIWLALAMIMRPFHPPVIEGTVFPDGRQKKIGWLAVALFLLTFVPRPIY